MLRQRRARILAILGPSSSTPDQIYALALAGADVFRLNFSHGSRDDVVVVAGFPSGRPGRTNLLHVVRVGEEPAV
jgi:pyruvate kinase